MNRVPVPSEVRVGNDIVGVYEYGDKDGRPVLVADFAKTDRQFLEMAERHPRRAGVMLSIAGRVARLAPRQAMKSFAKELSTRDRAVLEEGGPPAEQIALFTQAFLRGAGGVVADYQVLAKPWGFDVGPTPVPVSVWHGDADTMVPLAHSRALVDLIPGASLTVWPGEGHLGTISHIGEILDAVSTG